MRSIRRKIGVICASVLWSAGPASADDVTVFAAASLKTALDEIAPLYEAKTGNTLRASYAGTSALARQIEAGAPADVFIAANAEWMDVVEASGLIDSASRIDLLSNDLVLISFDPIVEMDLTNGQSILDLIGDDYLAMAFVNSVPAGIYGKEALEALGIWTDLSDQVVQSDNVRSALTLVARGEAPFGIVYGSDAAAFQQVHVAGRFPSDLHAPIRYPAARLLDGDDAGLLDFLRSQDAQSVFLQNGFGVIEEAGDG